MVSSSGSADEYNVISVQNVIDRALVFSAASHNKNTVTRRST